MFTSGHSDLQESDLKSTHLHWWGYELSSALGAGSQSQASALPTGSRELHAPLPHPPLLQAHGLDGQGGGVGLQLDVHHAVEHRGLGDGVEIQEVILGLLLHPLRVGERGLPAYRLAPVLGGQRAGWFWGSPQEEPHLVGGVTGIMDHAGSSPQMMACPGA